MTAPAAIILDIGNVLIEWQPERFYDRTMGAARRREMFAAVDLHAMNDRVDLGQGFRDIVYETAEAYSDFRTQIRMWHDHWLELASPVIDRSVRLLRALRAKGLPVHALTNFGIESFDLACRHFDFLTEFDHAFVSGRMGVIKPDSAIFARVEAELGVGGEARGWRSHLFTTPEGWADRLVAEGQLATEGAG